MSVAWRIKSSGKGVMQVGEGKVALNMEIKRNSHFCGKYGHTQNKRPKKNKTEEGKGNKKLSSRCNHCDKVGHKSENCWEHEVNKDHKSRSFKH